MAKNYQDIYNSVYVTGNKMDWTNAMIRGNGIPLDIYSVFDEYNEAVKFAATNAVAYEGQVLAVTENGDTTVYVITPAKQGTVVIDEVETDIYLKEVGSATLGDNKGIVLTDGVLTLKNFGVEYYAYDSEKKAWDEEATEGWVEGLQPKVINVGTTDEPVYEIAWFEPSSTTVEGLSESIGTLTERVATAEGTIKTQSTSISDNATAIAGLEEDKADKATTLEGYGITDAYTKDEADTAISNAISTDVTPILNNKAEKATTLSGYGITDAYTKEEVDGKVSGAFHFKGSVDYQDLLPTNASEGDVYVVKYMGSSTNAGTNSYNAEFAWNGTNWVEFGSVMDMSGYATKSELKDVSDAIDAINDETDGILATAKGYTDAEVAKNKELIDANIEAINGHTTAIEAINNETDGILATAKGYTDTEVAKNKELIDANADEIENLKTADTENLATAKGYTDTEVAKNKALIDAINNETTGILATAKAYTDEREIEINKNVTKNAEAIDAINNSDTGVLKQAKDYADGLNTAMDSRVAANTSAIDAINNGDTGILVTAKGYTDTEVAKNKALIDQNILDIKSNKDAIDAINNVDTGILVTAKSYTDTEVGKNKALIDAINNADTGILVTAKSYTDTEVAKNKALIDAINNETTGILATAKGYTDAREIEINKNVTKNAEDIAKINDADTGILKQAKDYADDQIVTKIASSNCMVYRGTVGEGGTVAELPTSNVKNGDTYKVLTDGIYEGQQAFTGDMFIAVVTTTDDTVTIAWTLIPSGDDGNVNTAAETMLTDGALIIGKGNKEIGVLANGTEGQIVRVGNDGKPYYEDELTYEVTSSDASISVTDNSEGREGSFDITVKSVSTDVLVQGNNILILDGGNSNGSYSVTI